MSKTKQIVSSEEMVQVVIAGMQEIKAQDITILDLKKLDAAATNYFVICTATSFTHLSSIIEEVEMSVLKAGGDRPKMNPNKSNQQWLVMDYFNVIVHVFLGDVRKRFGLEELWGDAKITNIENI